MNVALYFDGASLAARTDNIRVSFGRKSGPHRAFKAAKAPHGEGESMASEHLQSLITSYASRAAGVFEAHLDYRCADVLKQCESPIEDRFLSGLLGVGIQYGVETQIYSHAQSKWFVIDDDCRAEYFKITPQWKIGHKRIDFHIEYGAWRGWDKEQPVFDTACLLVECDGHDYHERTKEQAKKDRSRDRQLQVAGFDVFRFTGAEIHADAFGCAEEIHDYFRAKVKELRALKVVV